MSQIRSAAQLQQQVRTSQIPTLGNPVRRSVLVPQDRLGQYVGADTQVNVREKLFNKKKYVEITAEWANVLNALVQQGQDNGSGMVFTADPDARITIDLANRGTFVPGSQQQVDSNSPFGLVSVRNPAATYKMGGQLRNDRQGNFIRVGGDSYRHVIASTLSGATALPMEQIAKLVVQGWKYGLAEPLSEMGIIVHSDGRVDNIQNFDASVMKAFYDDFLKNPDQRRLGGFAAASAVRNHAGAGHIIDKRTGQLANPADLVAAYEQNGSIKGRFGWADGLKSSKQRAGLTSHPLRSADGAAVQGAVMDPNAGECNIYGSGPGMGGNGHDDFSLRLYKGKREHRRKSTKAAYGSRAGVDRSIGAPTYYCAPTRAEVVDATRSVYQAGGSRGGNVGLGTALDQISQDINDPTVSAVALAKEYTAWSTDANRAPPQFRVPDNIPGREGKGGFALFQAARGTVGPDGRYIVPPVGKTQGRAMSHQFSAQQANSLLPAGFQAAGAKPRAPAGSARRGATTAAPAAFNPFAPQE